MGVGANGLEGYSVTGSTTDLFSLDLGGSQASAKAFEEALQREAGSSGVPYLASQNNASTPSEGDKKPEEESSTWTRVMGGLKMVGGAAETAVGSGLVAVGAATSEFGVGIPIAAAGGFVAAHGADTTISGFRTMVRGEDVDSFTSQGLQGLGTGRTVANLTDAGIGIAGSVGSSAVLRAPAVASALTKAAQSETSVTVAYGQLGPKTHNAVGVDKGGPWSQWTHLVEDSSRNARVVPENAGRITAKLPNSVTVPISAERAEHATQAAAQAIKNTASRDIPFGLFSGENCAKYARDIMREGGLWTLPIAHPTLNYLTAATQSPEYLNGIRPTLSAMGLTAGAIDVGVATKDALDKE